MDDCNLYGRAVGLDERGRHITMESAVNAVLQDLLTEKNEFFDLIADRWALDFPGLPIRPGRYEDGKIYLHVANASMLYTMRPKLRMIKAKLAELPGAPKKLDLRLEINNRRA